MLFNKVNFIKLYNELSYLDSSLIHELNFRKKIESLRNKEEILVIFNLQSLISDNKKILEEIDIFNLL